MAAVVAARSTGAGGAVVSAAVQARRALIAARYTAPARPIVVAREMGISYPTAVFDLRVLGINPGKSGRQKGEKEPRAQLLASRVLRAVQADPLRSLESFGEEFGISRERVRQIIKEAGLPKKPDARKPAPVRDAQEAAKAQRAAVKNDVCRIALRLRAAGLTYEEIGQSCGIATMTAFHRVKRAERMGLQP